MGLGISKFKLRWLALLALVVGCAKDTVGPNIPMTRVPKGLAWCGEAGPVHLEPPKGISRPLPDLISSERLHKCTNELLRENPYLNRDFWQASILFGVSSNQLGELTEVCVWEGNLGNTEGYVTCIADTLLTGGLILSPNLRKARWELTFVME